MPQPLIFPGFSRPRRHPAVLEELRRLIPGMADCRKTLPFGLAALDSCLPEGGLPAGALHEIVPAPHAVPACLGFIAAIIGRLPPAALLLFVLPAHGLGPHGRLYGHGLRTLGLDPARVIVVETAHRKDTLWTIEEALRSRAPAAVAGIVDKFDLRLSQRLHLAAVEAGLPLLLVRSALHLESSAAATRWRVGTAAAARDRFGLVARPRWRLRLERARNGRTGEWLVEYDHVAHRFSLAAALADPAHAGGASAEAGGTAHCA